MSSVIKRRAPTGGWLFVWLGVTLAVAVAALLIGTRIVSPLDSAAQNSERAVPVAVAVTQGSIAEALPAISGKVSLGRTLSVAPTSVGNVGESTLVVTASPRIPGDSVENGSLIVEVSGRPIIALEMAFPPYRSIEPGASGRDVEALQQALMRLGHYAGTVDGKYGPGTASAVTRFYRAAGYEPPAPSPEVQAAVLDAEVLAAEADAAVLELASDAEPAIVAAARRTQADADARLAAARFSAAARLAAGEVFAITGPATVAAAGQVGSAVSLEAPAAVVRLGAPSVVLRATLDVEAAFLEGTAVTITRPGSVSDVFDGTVVAISEFTANEGAPGVDVSVAPTGPLPSAFVDGSEVTATPSTAPPSVAGLEVPLVGLRQDGEGASYVLVVRSELDSEGGRGYARVPVLVLAEGRGKVIVEAESTGSAGLRVGDQILLGDPP
ncbi:peptidoglycan-binding protein [Actinotalea subterranea]|uniref:peptidoglycan-binding protein n=1 Tax=Actinotalea subterranea TaxID=2607497 RepID=UPI0011EF00A7|nr:peptidoglycan-binding protein [Actinotalea subterranea]